VPASLGGISTVAACKPCNDALGAGVEGRLVSPTGWFTVLAQGAGFVDGFVDATDESGGRAQVHFGARGHRKVAPTYEIIQETEDVTEIAVVLPSHVGDGYLEHLAKQFGGSLSITARGPAPAEWHRSQLGVNISDLRRLAAKIALCAGTSEWGDSFTMSPLADWLRVVLDICSDWPEAIRPPASSHADAGGHWPLTQEESQSLADDMKRSLEQVLARVTAGGPTITEPMVPAFTIFAPADGGRQTLVSSVVLGLVLPVLGADQPMPQPELGPRTIFPRTRWGGGGPKAPIEEERPR
jgi:hypothetical protein